MNYISINLLGKIRNKSNQIVSKALESLYPLFLCPPFYLPPPSLIVLVRPTHRCWDPFQAKVHKPGQLTILSRHDCCPIYLLPRGTLMDVGHLGHLLGVSRGSRPWLGPGSNSRMEPWAHGGARRYSQGPSLQSAHLPTQRAGALPPSTECTQAAGLAHATPRG